MISNFKCCFLFKDGDKLSLQRKFDLWAPRFSSHNSDDDEDDANDTFLVRMFKIKRVYQIYLFILSIFFSHAVILIVIMMSILLHQKVLKNYYWKMISCFALMTWMNT